MSMLRRVAGMVLLVCAVGWVGCGSPRERYKTLSVFFDGVPNPDAPKLVAKPVVATTGPAAARQVIVSSHKPYVNNQCDA